MSPYRSVPVHGISSAMSLSEDGASVTTPTSLERQCILATASLQTKCSVTESYDIDNVERSQLGHGSSHGCETDRTNCDQIASLQDTRVQSRSTSYGAFEIGAEQLCSDLERGTPRAGSGAVSLPAEECRICQVCGIAFYVSAKRTSSDLPAHGTHLQTTRAMLPPLT